MEGLTWRIGNMHPFDNAVKSGKRLSPDYQKELSEDLSEITGFSRIFFTAEFRSSEVNIPGLMVYQGISQRPWRNMKGTFALFRLLLRYKPWAQLWLEWKVVVVNSGSFGNIDVNDLRKKQKCIKIISRSFDGDLSFNSRNLWRNYSGNLVKLFHNFGGQVYMDGANMNAQVGLYKSGNDRGRCLSSESA